MALTAAELVKADQDHLIHPLHHPVDNAEPMIYVRGRGSTITDIGGHEYLDGLSGLWNVNVGHGRTELADAASDQIKEMAYFTGYVGSSNVPAISLAGKLIELSYGMQAVFFTSGGAESNESAFKTARFYWKARGKPDKVKVISRFQGYHGVTLQAMSATGMANYWKMFEPRVPGFVHIQTCYPYRFQGAKPGETVGQAAARELEEAILREGPGTVAAFIAEPIHGGGGVLYPTDDYFPLVREVCNRHEVLFIADEVITGFCRTGKWFAMSHWNVKPDIMSFAKGVTSGYLPLGGIMVSQAIKEAMDSVKPEDRWNHAYTYSATRPAVRSGWPTSRSWNASGCGRTRPRWAPACTRASRPPSVTIPTPATSAAARGCWPRWSWSRIARPRRTLRGTARSPHASRPR
jgi:adenosylmethionine-8-amino-7-oxononanoate aminotransferase